MKPILFKSFGIVTCLFALLSCSEEKEIKPVKVADKSVIETSNVEAIPLEKLEPIASYEAFCKTLILGDSIETFTIEWPGDEYLCDSYDGSDGPLSYTIYRLARTKQIIRVSEHGAYCQGDSDFGADTYFDAQGRAVYYSAGESEYSDQTILFYTEGIPSTEVIHRPPYGEEFKRVIQIPISSEFTTTGPFLERIESLLETMQERILSLEKVVNEDNENRSQKAQLTIDEITHNLFSMDSIESYYSHEFILRMPSEKRDFINLKRVNVEVKENPSVESESTGTVSYYNNYISINEIGEKETIAGLGTHHWYEIVYKDSNRESQSGWIFGSDVTPWMYYD